jgi:hypothetical protein
MAYYAELDKENKVVSVKTASDEDSFHGEYVFTISTGKRHVRTSYNTRGGIHYDQFGNASTDQSKAFRKNAAGVGFTYDQERDAFVPPSPFESWILNQETCLWDAPVPKPEVEGKTFIWNEETTSWKEVTAA